MNENQKLKMQLLQEFSCVENPISFCREAYKFLTEDKEAAAPVTPTDKQVSDGIYLVYETGHYTPFTSGMGKSLASGVKYIGIVHTGHAFCVALRDLGQFPLIKEDVECEDESDFYVPRECDALNDWECIERTKRIQELGTDIKLNDSEYIPALPMVVAMCYWADKGLNEALEFVGGQPFDMDSYYWSVTEFYSNNAWIVNFGSGYVNTFSQYYSDVVRPVAAFNL